MKTNNWNIDTTHSGINFSVRHMVFAKVRGRFDRFTGTIEGDLDDLTQAKVAVDIDAASIDTGVADRDTHLRSADFFDAEQFPSLRFVSQRIERTSDDHYQVHGELTVRDVSREVTLEVDYGGRGTDPWGNERVGFSASTSINRREFGLKWNQVLETGGMLVGDRIDIELEVQAVAAAAAQAA